MSERRTTLTRILNIGDSLSFDGGRLVLQFIERSGRSCRVHLNMERAVVIDRPAVKPGVPVRQVRSPHGCEVTASRQ